MAIRYEHTEKAVLQFGKGVVKRSRANLTREKANSSKTLWKSIKFKFKEGVIAFYMEPYGAFLDKGVTGTGTLPIRSGPRGGMGTVKNLPVAYNKSEARPEYSFKSKYQAIGGSLKKWLQTKSLPASLDFIIRRSVHARGIRARRFFTEAFDFYYDRFDEELDRVITLDIEDNLDNILDNLKD